ARPSTSSAPSSTARRSRAEAASTSAAAARASISSSRLPTPSTSRRAARSSAASASSRPRSTRKTSSSPPTVRAQSSPMKRVVDILRIVVARAGAGKARGSATLRRRGDVSSIPRIDTERSSPRDLHPPSVPVRTETVGAGGTLRLTIRADSAEGVVRDALLDPDRFVPPPRKRSQEAKLQKRRAVYSFRAEVQGHEERLYLKLYRPGSAKEALDELLFGRRAFRSLHRGLEAERRGIGVALHY